MLMSSGRLPLKRRLQLALRILQTRFRFSLAAAELYSIISALKGRLKLAHSKPLAAENFMTAHRTTRKPARQIRLEKTMQEQRLWSAEVLDPLLPKQGAGREFWPKRVIKMKEPSAGERGALVISFDVFGQMAAFYDLRAIMRDYHLILEPSWSGYCVADVMQFVNYPEFQIIVQAAEKLDFDFLKRINTNLIPIDIGASNWVDDRAFCDLNLDKDYDCIMVSHFGDLKRHYHLFDALRRIDDPGFRVCLVGEPWGGRSRNDLEDLARYYGVLSNLDIYQQISAEEVNRLLNRAKVNILLSRKEGANRSIFEGLFANVPGIVLATNCGVNKTYINEHTGKLITDSELAEALLWFRSHYRSLNPRKWALENISCQVSTRRLDGMLKEIARDSNEPWTRPLVPKVNRPEFEFYDQQLTPFDFERYSIR